jgi:hypothetical protein
VEGAAEGDPAANGGLVRQSIKRKRTRWKEAEEEGGSLRDLQERQDASHMLLEETAAGKTWVGKMQGVNTFLSQSGDVLRYRDKTVLGVEAGMDGLRNQWPQHRGVRNVDRRHREGRRGGEILLDVFRQRCHVNPGNFSGGRYKGIDSVKTKVSKLTAMVQGAPGGLGGGADRMDMEREGNC